MIFHEKSTILVNLQMQIPSFREKSDSNVVQSSIERKKYEQINCNHLKPMI